MGSLLSAAFSAAVFGGVLAAHLTASAPAIVAVASAAAFAGVLWRLLLEQSHEGRGHLEADGASSLRLRARGEVDSTPRDALNLLGCLSRHR